MKTFVSLMDDVLDCAEHNPKMAMKYVGETAIIIRVISRHRPELTSQLNPIAERCAKELSRFQRLACFNKANDWRIICMPYVCLKHFDIQCSKLEGLLSAMHEVAPRKSERYPYENCEDDYILAVAGLGDFPEFSNAGWDQDCLSLYSFRTDDIYHYTHRHFYATDFSTRQSYSKRYKPELFLLLSKAVIDQNADLAAEIGICLLGERLNQKELGLLDAFMESLQSEIETIFSNENVPESYHPQYVIKAYQLIRETVSTARPNYKIMHRYTDLYESLERKCPDSIERSFKLLCKVFAHTHHLRPCIEQRYLELKTLAFQKVLFAQEAAHLNQEIPDHIYSDYLGSKILLGVST